MTPAHSYVAFDDARTPVVASAQAVSVGDAGPDTTYTATVVVSALGTLPFQNTLRPSRARAHAAAYAKGGGVSAVRRGAARASVRVRPYPSLEADTSLSGVAAKLTRATAVAGHVNTPRARCA